MVVKSLKGNNTHLALNLAMLKLYNNVDFCKLKNQPFGANS